MKWNFCILIFSLLLTGCGSLIKQPPAVISYYQLDYKPQSAKSKVIDKTLSISPFFISEMYNRNSIIYADKYKTDFYRYKQWISAPQVQITELFRRDFIDNGAFKAVILPGQLLKPDLTLSAAITEISENRSTSKTEAVLKITATLIKPAEKREPPQIIFQKNYIERVPCEKNNVESLVEALSVAAKEISCQLQLDVIKAVK